MTEHVEIVHARHENPQIRWSPVVGAETVRLLESSQLDDAGEQMVRNESVSVLARCADPATDEARTGLVVGYVQSGKTLSFTTVISLARDNGIPLIVLLAGTKENLHDQTAERLSKDLAVERDGGLSPWALLENPVKSDAQTVADNIKSMTEEGKPEKFRRATVITVMKNPSRLSKVAELLAELAQYQVDLEATPVLLVDDEADQAGLNAAILDDSKEMTSTYEAIVNLRTVLPRHTYLMYTATPQAPLLINLADVLSPDFVSVLTPGAGYTGGHYFFEEHKERFVKRLSSSAVTAALTATTEPPDELQMALATYYLVVAQRGDGPVSMLVHPSQTKDLHQTYNNFVTTLSSQWKQVLQAGGEDRNQLVETWFSTAYDDLVEGGAQMRPLEELLGEIPHWIGATQIRMVNSQAEANKVIKWKTAPSWILIGGNKLDRGFTVEGLTTTFMPRPVGAGQVDTVQQRARFFGYKSSYAPLCRAWLNGRTASVFEHYVQHERLLRKELKEADTQGLSLKQWKRQMLLDPLYKPTRRAVIDLDYFHDRVRGDSWMSISKVPIDSSIGGPLEDLWSAHSSHAALDERDGRTGRRNKRVLVPMSDLVEAVLDWVTPEEGSKRCQPAPEDVALLNQLALLLRAHLDDDESLQAELYSMDDGHIRTRQPMGGFVNLPVGHSANYKGDDVFHTDGMTSVQLHRVEVKGGASMLGLRVRVPKSLAGGVLVQS